MSPEKPLPKSHAHHLATEVVEDYLAIRLTMAFIPFDTCGCDVCDDNVQAIYDQWWQPKTKSPHED